ncbi:MAG: type II toxin-antitoxin system mRNA interferase toxin, RelE/StbE family [Deltaproteobacteria bacterium]|nr:type II toxin-antitoxin system mRNA interferase toxin, RelE/StbE family [Deltaproteobacteria bacterium]
MEIHYTSDFIRSLRGLPKETQRLAARQEEIFRKDPNDTRLHTKALKGRLKGFYSFRVTRNYRALYAWKETDVALFYEIGDRQYIYLSR